MVETAAALSEGAVRANARSRIFSVLRKAWKKRQSEGMTAKELAALLGRDKGQVSRVLNGSVPTITLETLALFLDRLDHQLIVDCRPAEEIPASNVDSRHAVGTNAPQKPVVMVAPTEFRSPRVSFMGIG